MVRNASLVAMLFGSALLLVGCGTSAEDGWIGGGSTPFDRARRTCETQAQSISDQAARPAFQTGCMRALGWTPRPAD